MTPILFFTHDIAIRPHSASTEVAQTLEKATSIGDFARATQLPRLSLYELANGELRIEGFDRTLNKAIFMEGPEA